MRMGPRTVTLLALVALAPLTIGAQVNAPAGTMHDSIVTSAGVCRVWDVPPVNASFPDDASYNDCALDQRAKVLSRTKLALAPARGMWMHAQYVVIVEPNGSVNERLTRYRIADSPPGFLDAIRDSLTRWKFQPATRRGNAVRSALLINLTTVNTPTDAVPYRLE